MIFLPFLLSDSDALSREFVVTSLQVDDKQNENSSVTLILSASATGRDKAGVKSSGAKGINTSGADIGDVNAIALDSFAMEKRVSLPRSILQTSPWFSRMLQNDWKNAYSVSIRLSRFGAVEALLSALEFLSSGGCVE